MKTITLKFYVGDLVEIPELECEGRVISIFIGDHGIQYKVRYFDKAEARAVYFFEKELRLRGNTDK